MNELYVRHRAKHGRVVAVRYRVLDAKTNPWYHNSTEIFGDSSGKILRAKKKSITQSTKGKNFMVMKDPSQIYDLLIRFYESLGFSPINIVEGGF